MTLTSTLTLLQGLGGTRGYKRADVRSASEPTSYAAESDSETEAELAAQRQKQLEADRKATHPSVRYFYSDALRALA